MATLSKAYNPQETEAATYTRWERSGFFNPDKLPGKRSKRFTIAMPPPNVTGELHLGHAEGLAIQDTLIRYKRMAGFKALWIPGTDHAGIATQIMVERLIAKEGLNRQKLGREQFIERVWQWKQQYGSSIIKQIRSLGASCDWSREAFTMDKERSLAVRTAFKTLFDKGLIYRGRRIINWCPRCASAISDLEVKYVATTGKLYHIRYPLTGSTKYITVATTRPETMLGDTAVAVHPHDKRYKHLDGKTVMLPIIEREIPIVIDAAVEQGFGTGAVKVTPAHDPVDYEIGERHHLPVISVIDETATMSKEAGEFYGMHVLDARRMIVERLERDGHIESIEDYQHNVAHCERCGTVIEPLISLQWFMNMQPLAKEALRVVKKKHIQFVPERFTRVYDHWLKNIHDWTISRQLWWGHQIPIWYCEHEAHPPIVSIETPKRCPTCKSAKLTQDPDTLDTWFSSGLWTFATLGWPKKTKDLKNFHPTDVMETSWDILFYWVARMTMLSLALLGEVPFKTVYLHGLVLDAQGKKMSKSKGTGIDPIPMAQKYGTDAIRLSLMFNTSPGQDFRLSEEKIANYRNFINKVWNVGRFIESLKRPPSGTAKAKTPADKWIVSRLRLVVADVTKRMDAYRLSEAGEVLYRFMWHELADWYVEITKIEGNVALLREVYAQVLTLLHPFAPFVTEEIWQRLRLGKGMLMVAQWPKVIKAKPEKTFERVIQAITAIRTVRNVARIPAGDMIACIIAGVNAKFLLSQKPMLIRLARLSEIKRAAVPKPTLVLPGLQIHLALTGAAEQHIAKEREQLIVAKNRITQLLANPAFVKKAPDAIIKENREKLAHIAEQIESLGG